MDVSYSIHVHAASNTATIEAQTPFGALYGLETFSQMVNSAGIVLGDGISIQDAPSFRHRGLTIDVAHNRNGRKYIHPVWNEQTLCLDYNCIISSSTGSSSTVV